jgi:hypothetical protein
MSYVTFDRRGQIVEHSTRSGRAIERPLPTKTIACDACGWTTRAVDDARSVLERCICGGTLRVTVAIKEANKPK